MSGRLKLLLSIFRTDWDFEDCAVAVRPWKPDQDTAALVGQFAPGDHNAIA